MHVSPIKTFDSGATKPSEKRTEPKAIADVDLEAIRIQMADVVQRAAESDPKALRAKVKELERKLPAFDAATSTVDEASLERIREEARAVRSRALMVAA